MGTINYRTTPTIERCPHTLEGQPIDGWLCQFRISRPHLHPCPDNPTVNVRQQLIGTIIVGAGYVGGYATPQLTAGLRQLGWVWGKRAETSGNGG